MQMIDIEEVAFQASTLHPGIQFYVVNALKGDQPVNENGYLVMVNELGDRVACRMPGGQWQIDATLITGYNPEIPDYVNAIHILSTSFEYE